uniref:Lethal(3)malignant brain tumor-like protein 4 n=1 Tax=Castor canadensis TaxID=51338 RepID=A0A8B7TYT2_CASCN
CVGYRLRLHLMLLSSYDFWTNAGSPDIHPVGWCEKTKHELHIPKGYRKDKFVWMDYLKACKLQNAPKKLFRSRSSNGPVPKEFQVGMKLEAVDRKNPSLVCVATIADIVEDRLRVHFDNWDDSYDYWCDINSPYVQPVGWCHENGRTLIAPQGEQTVWVFFEVLSIEWLFPFLFLFIQMIHDEKGCAAAGPPSDV